MQVCALVVLWLAAVIVMSICLEDLVTKATGTLGLIPTAFLGAITCMMAMGMFLQLLYGKQVSIDQVRYAWLLVANVGQAQFWDS